MDDDAARSYPWLAERDDRFTLALILDVGEVLVRHGRLPGAGRGHTRRPHDRALPGPASLHLSLSTPVIP
jgi:hypothetical protein